MRNVIRLFNRLPYGVKHTIFQATKPARALLFSGHGAYCPVCDHSIKRFWRFAGRENEMCPICASLSRQRFIWLWLKRAIRNKDVPNNGVILHIAPAPCLSDVIRKEKSIHYIKADLLKSNVDVKLDITGLPLKAESVHVILCSHVLEHVRDENGAFEEFARVLVPAGLSMIAVPIESEKTIEESEGLNHDFGHPDHVRSYGLDIVDRLNSKRLKTQTTKPRDLLTEDEMKRNGIKADEILFLSEKE